MVWRNLALGGLLGLLLLPQTGRALDATDALTIGAGTVVAALLYMSIDVLSGRATLQTARLRDGSEA